jgi:hypothetical protein
MSTTKAYREGVDAATTEIREDAWTRETARAYLAQTKRSTRVGESADYSRGFDATIQAFADGAFDLGAMIAERFWTTTPRAPIAIDVDDVRENPHDHDPEFFGPDPAAPITQDPSWSSGVWRALARSYVEKTARARTEERAHLGSLLELANRARHEGDDTTANLAIAMIARRS